MQSKKWSTKLANCGRVALASLALLQLVVGAAGPLFAQDTKQIKQNKPTPPPTNSPIQHVIVIIGENRSFDHVFATYVPKKGQTVSNLLSKGIVNADGTAGPNYALSAQNSAVDETTFSNSPGGKAVYPNIPPPGTQSAPPAASNSAPAPFQTLTVAYQAELDLPLNLKSYNELLTGATGLDYDVVDTRLTNYNQLGSGVFHLTPSIKYDDYAGSPVHRFYQMRQQTDCNASYGNRSNPSGCLSDLFSWVEVSIGAGDNGESQPPNFNNITTGEGSDALAFYNVQQGDAPYLKFLADHFTLSDNFHQSVMGGTGANHIELGYGDAIWYSDGNGNPQIPPSGQIENPNPQPNTNDWYDQDGYSGGSYSNCSDLTQPGVAPVVNYLQSLSTPINPNCDQSHYYLLNNYNPGYVGDGQLDSQYTPFNIPPTSVRHIGDVLSAANISYTYFGEGWNLYVTDPAGTNPYDAYCNICNPFQYATDIMTNPAEIAAHIQDTPSLYEDIATNNLPAVSIVKPSGFLDGHPASSKLDLFEGFVKRIVDDVAANPNLASTTAIFITFDEGGGYYDSGYIQPLDFFGDGTRIPMLVVSAYSTGGIVDHTYYDHVSIDKFIERNWSLSPITGRSRDNFPNPQTTSDNPYVPLNSPAIGDLFNAFNFPKK